MVNPTNTHTAATEKIVADLAHQLGLPVPPATLWDRGSGGSAPRFVAVSAWAFENVLQWGQAKAGLSAAQQADLIPWASAMMPFESWINAEDRANEGNVLVAVEDGRAVGAWIDYAFSLDHVWKGNNKPACLVVPMFPAVGAPLNEIVIAVANKIAKMENATIEGIVNRIPSEFLPRPVADNITRNLVSRRANLCALVGGTA